MNFIITTLKQLLFVVTCVSFIIYTIFLLSIIRFRKKKPFSSSFFTLCIPLGFVDQLSVINSCLNFKLHDWQWFPGNFDYVSSYANVLAKIGLCTAYFCGYWQTLAMLSLALNRCTVIMYPLKHQTFWSKWLKLAVFGPMIGAFVGVLPQAIIAQFHYHCFNITGRCFTEFREFYLEKTFLIIASSFCAVIACITGMLYAAMFYAAYQRRHSSLTQRKERMELRFGICGFVTFLAMLCYGGALFSAAYSQNRNQKHTVWQYWYVIGDIYAWINPYLILTSSKMVRKGFIATVRCLPQLEMPMPPPPQRNQRAKTSNPSSDNSRRVSKNEKSDEMLI